MRQVDASGFVFGEIDSLPGCSQIAVSHAVFSVSPHQGAGKKAHAERLAFLRSIGYDYALCTVDQENHRQLAILERFKWKCLDCFKSSKTTHMVGVYGKQLRDEDYIATRGETLLNKGKT